jgi:hypothetical protein
MVDDLPRTPSPVGRPLAIEDLSDRCDAEESLRIIVEPGAANIVDVAISLRVGDDCPPIPVK